MGSWRKLLHLVLVGCVGLQLRYDGVVDDRRCVVDSRKGATGVSGPIVILFIHLHVPDGNIFSTIPDSRCWLLSLYLSTNSRTPDAGCHLSYSRTKSNDATQQHASITCVVPVELNGHPAADGDASRQRTCAAVCLNTNSFVWMRCSIIT